MVSGEKRNCEDENVLERITTILLDIEGTTTSISFVKDILFPYVRDSLKNYVNEHWNDEEFQADLEALKLQAKKDEEEKFENFCPIKEGDEEKESVIKNVLWQMDTDRKTTALKQLQGHIWREGYENGKLKGHVYDEVPQIFKKWTENGHKLYIYSSGSVEAQKLLFKSSEHGDLSGFITGYFDTEIGPKTEASSYTNIIKAVECDAGQILFLTDVVKEAVAADKAGLQVIIVVREGNAPLSDDERKAFTTISSFKDIVFESSNKKKKICEEDSVKKQCEKTENVEKMEESSEIENGDAEKMETDLTDPKPEDCNESDKTEENGKTNVGSEAVSEIPEAEPDNIDVDVDDSNTENSGGEKTVSSSSVEESTNATAETSEETEKPAAENAPSPKEETADSTDENPALKNNEKTEEEKPVEEEKKVAEKEEEKEEKSINGRENGEAKENNECKTSEEGSEEANGKAEEIEALPVKKVNADEQADSTVEVTA